MNKQKYLNKDEYPSVLSVEDIQEILGISRAVAYELVNSKQFYTVKVGRLIKVSKDVFINWLEGKDSNGQAM